MDEILSAALLLLFIGGAAFSWLDWRRRVRHLPEFVGPAWTCPNCMILNEAELSICWSCGAGIAGHVLLPERTALVESWQCPDCRAWNGMARRTCWSCSAAHTARKKRSA